MLVVPTRTELRARPLESARLWLTPIEPVDAADLWVAVEGSRAHLEPWLPWVPFNTDAEASHRYAEASALDWDHGRACRFAHPRAEDGHARRRRRARGVRAHAPERRARVLAAREMTGRGLHDRGVTRAS